MRHRSLAALAIAVMAWVGGHAALAQQQNARQLTAGPHGIFYIALNVYDFEKSKAFYTNIIGLKEIVQPTRAGAAFIPPTADSVSLSFDGTSGDQHLVLQHDKNRTKPIDHGDGLIRFTLKVDDMKAIVARGKAAGNPPFEDLGNIVRFHDPDGYICQVVQISDAPAATQK